MVISGTFGRTLENKSYGLTKVEKDFTEASMETPAEKLAGLKLDGNWGVKEKIPQSMSATGGCFSHGYLVEDASGRRAFLKALDFSKAFTGKDPTRLLEAMTTAYNFEVDLLKHCRDKRLEHVVHAIHEGHIQIDPSPLGNVPYIIFEYAEKDSRRMRELMAALDYAMIFRTLHNVANGLMQLHKHGIAHQDLKPSNILVFSKKLSKIGDLGRASHKGHTSPWEGLRIPGDSTYAPPELLYGHIDPDWTRRRLGSDLYMLGSLFIFFLTGLSMTALLKAELDESHNWGNWRGTYDEVLPYIQNAFSKILERFGREISGNYKDSMLRVVRELCNPKPELRGHPKSFTGMQNQYSLERYVTELDVLAKKVERGF